MGFDWHRAGAEVVYRGALKLLLRRGHALCDRQPPAHSSLSAVLKYAGDVEAFL